MLSRMAAPPMQRVPYDILREILLYSEHTMKVRFDEPEFDIRVLAPPITASHVCRSWRRALLSDPTMWTCLAIPEMKPDWIMELLRRSESSPLNVFFRLGDAWLEYIYEEKLGVLPALFEQIHRFSVLRVEIDGCDPQDYSFGYLVPLVQAVMSSLQRPAPGLQTFSFSYDYLRVDGQSIPDYKFLDDLFSGNAPNLKRIHHRLSPEFRESRCAVFNDLSELYLTPAFDMQFGPFLDLLEASPRLKLLHFYAMRTDVKVNFEPSSDRRVHLPCLEKLVLKVNLAVQLVSLVLKHITLPSNLKWYIASRHHPDLERSPILLQFLSQAHFTSLHIRFAESMTLLLQENQDESNQFDENGLMHIYEDIEHLAVFGISYIPTLKASCITHVDLEFEKSSGDLNVISIYVLNKMSHLEFLTARQMIVVDNDEWLAQWFIALVPNVPKVMKHLMDTLAVQGPNSGSGSIDLEDIISASDLDASGLFQPTVFPCPLLRKLTLEVKHTLRLMHVFDLVVCSVIRRKKGYPLQISIQCPQMEEGVEDILSLSRNGDVQIAIDLDQ